MKAAIHKWTREDEYVGHVLPRAWTMKQPCPTDILSQWPDYLNVTISRVAYLPQWSSVIYKCISLLFVCCQIITRSPSYLTNDWSSSSNPLTRQTADTLIPSPSMNSSRTNQTFNASLFSTSNLRCCKVCGFDFAGLGVCSENSQCRENSHPGDCRCIVEGSDRVGAVSAVSTAGSAHWVVSAYNGRCHRVGDIRELSSLHWNGSQAVN